MFETFNLILSGPLRFSFHGKEGGQQNHHHGLSEGRLWHVQDAGWESPLGEYPEGQRGPERLDILQAGSLKGTGAGCPHVPQDEAARKTTVLAEQGAFVGTQGKKGRSTTYGKKDRWLKRSTRVSLGHAERKLERLIRLAQLELRLATVVRENKMFVCFTYTSTTKKRGSRRVSISYRMPGGTLLPKMKKRLRYLMPLPQSLRVRLVIHRVVSRSAGRQGRRAEKTS